MTETQLDFYKRLAHALALQFGSGCEIVVHDLETTDPSHSIVAIENGHVTGRKDHGRLVIRGEQRLKQVGGILVPLARRAEIVEDDIGVEHDPSQSASPSPRRAARGRSCPPPKPAHARHPAR